MRGPATIAIVFAAVLAAGCGDQLGSAAGPNVVSGGVHYSGGPAPGVDLGENQPGTVRPLRDGERVAEQSVDEGEEFAFSVQRGTYTLSVNLGDFDCEQEVRVDRPQVDAEILCPIK